MRIASIIFICLGMCVNFSINTTLGIIGLGIGIWALVTLGKCQKNVLCGVLSIIFTGLIGGILYLCWDGKK